MAEDTSRIEHAKYGLLFNVRRSIRYHSRRRRFFDRFDLAANASSVVFGSAAIGTVLSQHIWLTVGAGATVSIVAGLNLVVGSVRMSRLHEELGRRFIELEKEIVLAEQPTQEDLNRFAAMQLDIETTEPPVLRVLDSLCFNELARAEGQPREEFVKIRFYQRWFAQFLDIQEHSIRTYKDLQQASS